VPESIGPCAGTGDAAHLPGLGQPFPSQLSITRAETRDRDRVFTGLPLGKEVKPRFYPPSQNFQVSPQ